MSTPSSAPAEAGADDGVPKKASEVKLYENMQICYVLTVRLPSNCFLLVKDTFLSGHEPRGAVLFIPAQASHDEMRFCPSIKYIQH